jgi:hypothetical protein
MVFVLAAELYKQHVLSADLKVAAEQLTLAVHE